MRVRRHEIGGMGGKNTIPYASVAERKYVAERSMGAITVTFYVKIVFTKVWTMNIKKGERKEMNMYGTVHFDDGEETVVKANRQDTGVVALHVGEWQQITFFFQNEDAAWKAVKNMQAALYALPQEERAESEGEKA